MTYKVQIDDVVRDATAEEAAIIEVIRADAQRQNDAQAAREVARQAVLDRLGLSAAEVQLLLGA
jgi:hypothetical protein